jgi:hypothetical protein
MRSLVVVLLAATFGSATGLADGPRARPRNAAIGGRVVDRSGKGVPRVHVRARDWQGNDAWATTGPDGAFTIDELVLGSVTLTGSFLDVPKEEAQPVVAYGTTGSGTPVRVVVDPGAVFVLAIEPPPGKAPVLHLETETGWREWSAVVVDARPVFRRVRPGAKWVLWLHRVPATGRVLYEEGASLAPGEHSPRSEVGRPISGRVVLEPERPPAEPGGGLGGGGPRTEWVFARRGPVEVRAILSRDGSFEFDPLPEGPWTLRVQSRRWKGRPDARLEVRAGTTDVRFGPG